MPRLLISGSPRRKSHEAIPVGCLFMSVCVYSLARTERGPFVFRDTRKKAPNAPHVHA